MPRGGARRGAGRPRKTDEEKRRLGNPGKGPLTRLPTLPLTDGDLTGALGATWLRESDAPTIHLVQEAWDERLRLTDHIKEHGHVVTVPVFKAGELVATSVEPNPAVKMLRDLEKNLTVWLSQLGLNPSDRGKLGVAEVKVKSKVQEMEERRAKLLGRTAG